MIETSTTDACDIMTYAGGDFGKKELSPALANRFTTVWVPAIHDEAELAAILHSRLPGVLATTTAVLTQSVCRDRILERASHNLQRPHWLSSCYSVII